MTTTRVAQIQARTVTDLNLPEPIAAYFAADRRDGKAVARCFTKQAVVRDKYSYTSEPVAVERKADAYIVTSRLTGSFPGSPIEVRFVFHLERGKIAFLEITP